MPVELSPTPTTSAAPRPRRQAIATVLLLAAIGLLTLALVELRAHHGELDALAGAACRGDAAARAQLRRFMYVVLAIAPASTLAFAGYVAVLARRVRRERVFPPAGTWMIRPVRTFTGAAATRCAAVMIVVAATLATLALLLAAIGLRILVVLAR